VGMMTRAMHSRSEGSVCTGTWICEGHSVTFTILDNCKVSITESFRGNAWTRAGRNWSMNMKVELNEAIKEQDKYIRLGYIRMT
jgi:hypothetical protein